MHGRVVWVHVWMAAGSVVRNRALHASEVSWNLGRQKLTQGHKGGHRRAPPEQLEMPRQPGQLFFLGCGTCRPLLRHLSWPRLLLVTPPMECCQPHLTWRRTPARPVEHTPAPAPGPIIDPFVPSNDSREQSDDSEVRKSHSHADSTAMHAS